MDLRSHSCSLKIHLKTLSTCITIRIGFLRRKIQLRFSLMLVNCGFKMKITDTGSTLFTYFEIQVFNFLVPCGFVLMWCACLLNIPVRPGNQLISLMHKTLLNCGR